MSEDRGTAENSAGSLGADDHADTAGSASRPTGKRPGRRSRAAGSAADEPVATTAGAGAAAVSTVKSEDRSKAKPVKPRKDNFFKRLRKYLREVISELRKVIWPNRKQMITYTTVVLVFVAFMVVFISGLDVAFIKGVSWLFG